MEKAKILPCGFTRREENGIIKADKEIKMFEPLTKFIEPLKEPDKLGTWRSERYDEKGNIVELVIPYIDYCGTVKELVAAIEKFNEDFPQFHMLKYMATLKAKGVYWDADTMKLLDVRRSEDRTVLCLLMGLVRGEYFCTGIIEEYISEGHVNRWLERLKYLDELRRKREIPKTERL